MTKLDHFFESLKRIAPDQAYTARSRELILAAPQKPHILRSPFLIASRALMGLRVSTTLVLTSLLILLLLGGIPYLRTTLPLRVTLDERLLSPALVTAREV